MSETQSSIAVTFRVILITTTEFSWDNKYIPDEKSDSLSMRLTHHFSSGKNNNELDVKINVQYFDKITNSIVASLTSVTVFQIQNISQFANRNANEYDLPEMFLITAGGIGLSHTRALVAHNTNNAYMIPIINPTELFSESIRKSKESQSKK